MSPQAVPEAVRAFLAGHIATLEHFQLLLMIIEAPDRWWDAQTAARELGIAEADARNALDALARQNLLDIRITGDVRYQFHPGTDDLRDAALAAADIFRRRPVAVLELITGGRRGMRDFADAFRIRTR